MKPIKTHPSYRGLTSTAVLMPPVGIVLGIAYMTKPGERMRKLGEHVLATSIMAALVWAIGTGVLFFVLIGCSPASESVRGVDVLELDAGVHSEEQAAGGQGSGGTATTPDGGTAGTPVSTSTGGTSATPDGGTDCCILSLDVSGACTCYHPCIYDVPIGTTVTATTRMGDASPGVSSMKFVSKCP